MAVMAEERIYVCGGQEGELRLDLPSDAQDNQLFVKLLLKQEENGSNTDMLLVKAQRISSAPASQKLSNEVEDVWDGFCVRDNLVLNCKLACDSDVRKKAVDKEVEVVKAQITGQAVDATSVGSSLPRYRLSMRNYYLNSLTKYLNSFEAVSDGDYFPLDLEFIIRRIERFYSSFVIENDKVRMFSTDSELLDICLAEYSSISERFHRAIKSAEQQAYPLQLHQSSARSVEEPIIIALRDLPPIPISTPVCAASTPKLNYNLDDELVSDLKEPSLQSPDIVVTFLLFDKIPMDPLITGSCRDTTMKYAREFIQGDETTKLWRRWQSPFSWNDLFPDDHLPLILEPSISPIIISIVISGVDRHVVVYNNYYCNQPENLKLALESTTPRDLKGQSDVVNDLIYRVNSNVPQRCESYQLQRPTPAWQSNDTQQQLFLFEMNLTF